MFYIYFIIAKRLNHIMAISSVVVILVVISIIGLKLYNSEKYKYYVTHGTSTSLRTEQIQRVWRDKNEIGLLGRSMGTAGPSSQNRLDGGPNHWSENIYLDIFEETGLVGLVLYLALIIAILIELAYNFSDPMNKSAVLIIVSFALMGFFINIYTGQIGIFLVWLLSGLSQKGKLNVKNSN
jgi:cell division protein FtsW (lipid II flippase)